MTSLKLSPDEIRLRDEMAMRAMQGHVSRLPVERESTDQLVEACARLSYRYADAMMEARKFPVPADLDVSEVVK